MDNETKEQECAVAPEAEEQKPAEAEQAEPNEQSVQEDELQALREEIVELKLRLTLLAGGAAPEKLDEAVKLAAGLMSAQGGEPESAADEVLREYPHIRLAKRSIPKFSAESTGRGDGFAAIRSIFAKR